MMDPKINFFAANRLSALRGNGRALLMTGALIAFSSAGCGEAEQVAPPTPYDFEIAVMAVDSAENPVSKAPVILDGNLVGYTDRDGLYGATLTEFVGTEVTVSIGEMEAYFVPETATTTVALSRVKTIEGFSNSAVRLKATLESIRNDYLVWIDVDCAEEVDKAHCKDLPIQFDGKEIARTDAQGRAHFDFEGVPDQQVTLSIVTPTYTPKAGDKEDDFFEITPANPTYAFKLGIDAEVLTIKEKFSDPAAAKRLEEKKSRNQAAARRRAAQAKAKQKKTEAKKAKAAGVIDLW